MDKNKSLEQLENNYWGDADKNASKLVKRCHTLRKKPLEDLDVEDIRLLIKQNIGLKYLIPLAVDALENSPFVEGDFYEGDLLESVLRSSKDFWNDHPDLHNKLESIFVDNEWRLRNELDVTNDIRDGLIDAFHKFKESQITA